MEIQTRGIKGRNGEIITTWDELELYFIEQDKEIERLNDIIEKDKVLIKEANDRGYSEFEENVKLVNENSGLKFENKRLHSIIYELKIKFYETFRITQNGSYTITEIDYKDIEEILDKVGEE